MKSFNNHGELLFGPVAFLTLTFSSAASVSDTQYTSYRTLQTELSKQAFMATICIFDYCCSEYYAPPSKSFQRNRAEVQ